MTLAIQRYTADKNKNHHWNYINYSILSILNNGIYSMPLFEKLSNNFKTSVSCNIETWSILDFILKTGCFSRPLKRIHLNQFYEVDETGAYYTEWSKPVRKRPTQYTNTYIWNLERW